MRNFAFILLILLLLTGCNTSKSAPTEESGYGVSLAFTPLPLERVMSNPMPTVESLWQAPEPKPAFIAGVIPAAGETVTSPMVVTVELVIDEVTPYGDETLIRDHLTTHTFISIDGQVISHLSLPIGNDTIGRTISFGGVPLPRTDGSSGEISGHYGIEFETELSSGLHFMSVAVKTTDGRWLDYSWAFRVE